MGKDSEKDPADKFHGWDPQDTNSAPVPRAEADRHARTASLLRELDEPNTPPVHMRPDLHTNFALCGAGPATELRILTVWRKDVTCEVCRTRSATLKAFILFANKARELARRYREAQRHTVRP